MSQPFPVTLSHYQAQPLLDARRHAATTALTSPDLGLTKVEVALDDAGVTFPTGERLTWADAEEIDIASRLDPLSLVIYIDQAWIHYSLRDHAQP